MAAVPGVPRTDRQAPDGPVTAGTGIRFTDLVTFDLAPTNARQLAVLQPAFDTLVPFTVTFRPDGSLERAELNGRLSVPGAVLEVQLGIENRGVATPADFPAPTTDPARVERVGRVEYVLFIDAANRLQQAEMATDPGPLPPG